MTTPTTPTVPGATPPACPECGKAISSVQPLGAARCFNPDCPKFAEALATPASAGEGEGEQSSTDYLRRVAASLERVDWTEGSTGQYAIEEAADEIDRLRRGELDLFPATCQTDGHALIGYDDERQAECPVCAERAGRLAAEARLREVGGIIDCACNALTDSITCSGNDARTNLHWVRKLRYDASALLTPTPAPTEGGRE